MKDILKEVNLLMFFEPRVLKPPFALLLQTGGMGLWCPRIMCLVILLALLVYIFKLV